MYSNQAIAALKLFWSVYMLTAVVFQLVSDRAITHYIEVMTQVCINITGSSLLILTVVDSHETIATIWWPYQIFWSLLLLEFWFYYAHRLVHHRWFYSVIHKKHHRFKEPYAMTGVYCSLTEMILVNTMAVAIGPMMTGMSDYLLLIWVSVIAANVTVSHSGLVIPYISSGTHDVHHQKLNKNFGILGILDWIHGTYQAPF
uniref:Fatty acid hydroxylase family protein n=1 Tax=Pithovirus LCPAC103 TaxID=2506588 RepID=A0A481Z3A6_9VIRU|nr:MAG: fatty acid hydroxylase family protein [Pithovirus LCPAC103]